MFDKKALSERDICAKFITPAIIQAGWDLHTQIREEGPTLDFVQNLRGEKDNASIRM